MEAKDRERIHNLLPQHRELRQLYKEHSDFETRLYKLSQRPFLTTIEEQEEKVLKRLKLRGVDRMMEILDAELQQAA